MAGSFSETFKRNAINNGLLVLESPELVHDLRSLSKENQHPNLTQRTCILMDMHLDQGSVQLSNGKSYRIPTVGRAAQELMVAGGLESWVKANL